MRLATMANRVLMSDNEVIHQLQRIIDHERERAIQAKMEVHELKNRMVEAERQHLMICEGFVELLRIIEHHGIEVTGEILSPMTYSIIMNWRMKQDG